MKTCFCNMTDAVKIKPQYLDAVGDDIRYELRIVESCCNTLDLTSDKRVTITQNQRFQLRVI